ncbi:MAG: hypothetical protein HQ472_08690 [Ignavibacteria bacterium]|nr:hypothetical protein [Ignavibacteria bacterium]
MKYLVTIVLVGLCAASTLTADTLSIVSHRVVDMCSSEKKWLLSVTLGEIYFSDSLMSFDIAIGYDTTKVRPTDGLYIGTLSEFMRYGEFSPFFNFRVPGIITAGAFTINTPVKGDKPIFALVGDFVDSCPLLDSLFFPYEAEFNSEFKRVVTVMKETELVSTRIQMPSVFQGAWFRQDTTWLKQIGSDTICTIVLNASSIVGEKLKIDIELVGPKNISISDFITSSSGMVIDSIVRDSVSDVTSVHCTLKTIKEHEISFRVKSESDLDYVNDMKVGMKYVGNCECTSPAKIGRMIVKQEKVSTSVVDRGVNDSFEIKYINSTSELEIQNNHGHLAKVVISNIYGSEVYNETLDLNSTKRLSVQELTNGLYFVNCMVGSDQIVMKFLR